ncbi:MAG: hypothetical protein IJW14_00650 [Oscillospiraceae bacterium]|nr:hypothetical protein [Oscillospiraceae bacterium]
MDGEYDIYMGKDVVGTAQVERQGLYYRFRCSCRLSGDTLCRVSVCCNGHHENLGILVPMGDGFGLTKKLAVKKLGKGAFQFRVLPKHRTGEWQFVPVYPEEPFGYLTRLQNAFLEVRNGQAGVVIPD